MRERSIPRPLYLAEYNFLRVPFSVVLIFCFQINDIHVRKHDRSACIVGKQLRFNHRCKNSSREVCGNNDGYCDRSVSCLLWDASTL